MTILSMKAKNSNPELKYNLNEGKHKKTLLEKYLNEWTGNERSNGSVNLAEPNPAPKFIQKSSNSTKKKVTQKYLAAK